MATVLRYAKGHQFRDSNDLAVSAGTLTYFVATTTTPLVTFSDALGQNPNTAVSGSLVLDGAGRLQEAVYLGDVSDAKEVLAYPASAGGATVSPWPDDKIPRAQNFTPVDTGFAPPITAPLALNQSNSPATLSVNDAGKMIEASTASGDLTINLPPAASLSAGQGYWFIKTTAPHTLTINANGSDLIGDYSSFSASIPWQSFVLVSDGSKWAKLFDSDGSIGSFAYWAASAAPAGRAVCDGGAVLRTSFPTLFAVIDTTYGAGDGSTTFNLPDLRGEFIRGWDISRGVDTGRAFGSFQDHQFQDHTHGANRQGFDLTTGTGLLHTFSTPDNNSTDGPNSGNHGAETRPRNVAMLPTIKYQ